MIAALTLGLAASSLAQGRKKSSDPFDGIVMDAKQKAAGLRRMGIKPPTPRPQPAPLVMAECPSPPQWDWDGARGWNLFAE